MSQTKAKFQCGETVLYKGLPCIVYFILPAGVNGVEVEKEMEEGFKKYTPLMDIKNKLNYQQKGVSSGFIKKSKKQTYMIAGNINKQYYTISLIRAEEHELSKPQNNN